MSIDFNQLREFLVAIAQTDITELSLKNEDFELTLRKDIAIMPSQATGGAVASVVTSTPSVTSPSEGEPDQVMEKVTPTRKEVEKKWVAITSPMVGTFYRAPAPGEDSFVEINERIRSGQTVCIIEAMKLMNEIEAEVSGQVMEIVVENGSPVEYGQTLMWINPE